MGNATTTGNATTALKRASLVYPNGDLTKGPDTAWDAPGMQRIKLPYGGVTPEQLEVLATPC
jgi:sulfite reductase (ferredoxin)